MNFKKVRGWLPVLIFSLLLTVFVSAGATKTEVCFTILGETSQVTLTLEELKNLPQVSGKVAYEGPQTGTEPNWKPVEEFAGVPVVALLEKIGDLKEGRMVSVSAADGYTKKIPVSVLRGESPMGQAILALTRNGVTLPEWTEGPQLIFLPEDGRLSNEDILAGMGPKLAHYFGDKPSATGLKIRNVNLVSISDGQKINIGKM